MAGQIGFLIVVLGFGMFFIDIVRMSSTPELCPCAVNLNTSIADCHDRRLKEIPSCVPNTTKGLIFRNNDLTFQPGQLQRFTFLTDLDLSINGEFSPRCDSFDGLTQLKILDLSATNFTHLQTCVFSDLFNLEKLFLRTSNHISLEVSNNIFRNLSKLKRLYFDDNEGLMLYSKSFMGLSNLEYLSLQGTKIPNATSFPVTVFEPLKRIVEIRLGGLCSPFDNYYNCKALDQRLKVMSSLEILTLDNFAINLIGPGFASLKHLKEIYFGNLVRDRCNVESLSNKTFQNLINLPLSKIIINWCKITQILPFTFSSFRNLTYLEFYKVEVSQLCERSYIATETGLQNSRLTHLRLRLGCPDRRVSLHGLSGLVSTQLETLEFSDSVVWVEWSFFRSLPVSLKYLHLENNSIQFVLFCDLFRLQNLIMLSFQHQRDFMNDPNDLHYDKKKYELANNNFNNAVMHGDRSVSKMSNVKFASRMDLRNSTTCDVCQKLPLSLSTIDISYSGLLCDLVKIFCASSNSLKSLTISYQKQIDCFGNLWTVTKNLLKLEHFNLAGNGIKILPVDAFSQLRHLKNLSLYHNFLAVVEFDLQSQVLEYLDLSDNNILYISKKLTEQLDKSAERSKLVVNLSGNQLVCDCERIDFVAWLRYSNAIYQKDKLTCTMQLNKTYSLSKVVELHKKLKAECIAPEVLKGCISGFLVLNIVLGLCSVIWHRRWKIRYLLAVGRKNISPYHPIEECEIDLEYDVYISYERDYDLTRNETLHDFVAQKLYPELIRRGFKVLIREELEPGVGLYNAISQALRRCRKVISLVSKDYCRDYWNVFEFNVAVLEGIYTKRQVIIPVALENVEREDLHTEIYAYLRSGSVSYFSRNLRDEDLFDFLCEKIRDNREFE